MTEPDVDALTAFEFDPVVPCERNHHRDSVDGCKPSESASYYVRLLHGRTAATKECSDVSLVIAVCLSGAAYMKIRRSQTTQCPHCLRVGPLESFAEVLGPINAHGPK